MFMLKKDMYNIINLRIYNCNEYIYYYQFMYY